MKRSTLVLTALAVMLYLGGTVVFAQGTHGNAGLHRPTTRGADPGKRGPSTGSAKTPSQLLQQNTKLESKLQTLLNKKLSGTSLTSLTPSQVQQLASKFKNLGQFVAAVHVSNNLNIPFFGTGGLMAKMTGSASAPSVDSSGHLIFTSTGSTSSLGKAIQALDPNADPRTETRNATKQANQDIKESGS